MESVGEKSNYSTFDDFESMLKNIFSSKDVAKVELINSDTAGIGELSYLQN